LFWLLACTANAALLISAALTWTVRRFARVHGWMAGPASRRHIHKLPIPRLGGIAIFLGVAITAAIASPARKTLLLVLIPATWMFAVGLIDDLFGLRASRKLVAQIAGGALLFAAGFRIPAPLVLGTLALPLSFVITVGWSVLVMNAMNLVDGLDGLASGATICASAAMLLTALHFSQPEVALLAAALAGTTLGFYRFNAHPATIFLGDSGSLVIGTVVAAISIRLMQASPWGALVSILALAHPLGEVCLSALRRTLTAKPVFLPDRRHFHHRLLDRSLSHRRSSTFLVSISAAYAGLAILAGRGTISACVAAVLGAICASYVFRAFRYHEFRYLANLGRKVLNHRFSIDAHVQLHELRVQVEETRSISELRILIGQCLSGLGFADCAIQVYELESNWRVHLSDRGVELSFPLVSRQGNIGALRLNWDLSAPPPIDLDVFQTEFLPVLARTVNAHLSRHRELEISPAKKSGPVLVSPAAQPSRAGSPPSWIPMN
jgi:UDP-GlcNAc:undecaprenyl-phosphate GlcNAc-1-phosphate transferase